MIRRCREAGLPEPEFSVSDGFLAMIRRPMRHVTPEVAPEVRVTLAVKGTTSRRELQAALGLRDDEHFRTAYLVPALNAGLIEMTIPDKPTSRMQRYRLTPKGRRLLEEHEERKRP